MKNMTDPSHRDWSRCAPHADRAVYRRAVRQRRRQRRALKALEFLLFVLGFIALVLAMGLPELLFP